MIRSSIVVVLVGLFGCGGGTTPTAESQAEAARRNAHGQGPSAREPLGETRLLATGSDSPIVTLRVSFDAGSAEDPPGREGATYLAARLMMEGGAGDLSYAQLTERLFPMAAELDVQVDRDQTTFVARVHRDHLDAFYPLFLDVLARPRMGAPDFERLREQAKTALTLELRGNDDEALGKEVLHAMLYEGHPYGHPELGSEAGLSAVTLGEVVAQRAAVFCGPRAIVGVAGGYAGDFAERVKADVAAIRTDACVGRLIPPGSARIEAPRVLLVDKPEAQSVAVSMGLHLDVTRADPDYPALTLAAAYLGQHRQFVGILMQKIREQRGINYGDYAYAEHFDQAGWSVYPLPNTARRAQYFSIWLRPMRPEQAHFAIRLAVRELRRLVSEGMTAEDFVRVRDYIKGYYALYLQTESRRLGFAIDDAFYGVDQAYLTRLRAAWETMTADDVNAAVRRHLDPSQLQIAIVANDAGALAARLASDAPSPIEYAAEVSEEVRAEDQAVVGYRLTIPAARMRVMPLADVFR